MRYLQVQQHEIGRRTNHDCVSIYIMIILFLFKILLESSSSHGFRKSLCGLKTVVFSWFKGELLTQLKLSFPIVSVILSYCNFVYYNYTIICDII